jgi:hypothetical protein
VDDDKCPGVWTVEKINPVNLRLLQGNLRVNVPAWFLTKTDGRDGDIPIGDTHTPLSVGQVVKIAGRDGYWVVIKYDHRRANIAILGGDGGRYMRTARPLLTTITNFEFKELHDNADAGQADR